MKTITVLKKARALIKKGWHQGWFATDAAGEEVSYTSTAAKCFCVAGAVYRAAGDSLDPGACGAMDALTSVAPTRYKHSISQYNDAPRRTQEQVLGLFDRAIARAEKAGA